MELIILASVNLLVIIGMYLLFSLRLNRLSKRQNKSPLTLELEKNIELTVQFINASLELIDQKKKSFYQMLQRAEELNNQSLKSKKKSTTQKKLKNTKKETTSLATEPITAYTMQMKKRDQGINPTTREDTALTRALQELGPDIVELTPSPVNADHAYLLGASRYHQKTLQEKQNQQDNENSSLQKNFHSDPKENEMQGTELNIGKQVFSWFSSQTQLITQKLQKSILAYSVQVKIKQQPSVQMQKLNLPSPLLASSPIEKLSINSKASTQEDEKLEQGRGLDQDLQSTTPQLNPPSIANMDLSLPQDITKRTNLIRGLLKQNYSKEDISSATGITLAELNFIATLPESLPNKRRKRTNIYETSYANKK